MNKNTIILSIISVVAIFGFLTVVYMVSSTPENVPVLDEAKTIKADDHTRWASDKKIVMVEYADFQCPGCAQLHSFIQSQINDPSSPNHDLTKKVTFVYRYFPLTQIHKNAMAAAYSAEAAGKQGKFFEMGDLLFNNQTNWENANNPNEYFEGYAKELKLNMDQFKKDRDSQETKDRVNRDIQSGEKVQVNATPTVFVQGKKLSFASYNELIKALREAK